MNGAEKEAIEAAVKQAVQDAMPLAIGEVLDPMIKHTVAKAMTRWTRIASVGFLLLAIAFGVLWKDTRNQATGNAAEQRERVDQTCTLFETDHKSDVDQLASTYDYLIQARKHPDTIYRFVLARLPQQEAEARTDSAPEYCDVKGRGLPEPDPTIPRRPSALK